MQYTRYKLQADNSGSEYEILMALLGEIGFESFEETDEALLAFIQEKEFNQELFDEVLDNLPFKVKYDKEEVAEQNWNAVWESNFEPVIIGGRCHIRAPFHASRPDIEYEIVIEPKMSFGTAHHETTALMIGYLLDMPPVGHRLLDMGSGTGILAILAQKLGATEIEAIDNDDWAYNNAIENVAQNSSVNITVRLGDAGTLDGMAPFDTIYANINRNILLNDMKEYDKVLKKGGNIFMSGFYYEDIQKITDKAEEFGWSNDEIREKNKWVALRFTKE